MTDLENRIRDAAQKYYTDGSSDLTDAEFDTLVEELRKVNPNSDLFQTGWGYDVQVDSTPGSKIKHKYGNIGSLDKCHNWKELGFLLQSGPVDISLKLDGLSCVLYYEDSRLLRALTRGDGSVGIDVTDKIKHLIADTVNEPHFTGAVRGEIIMSYENFSKWVQVHPEAKNPRNSTAGIINSKDATEEDLGYLDLIVYTIVGDESIRDTWSDRYPVSNIRHRLKTMFSLDRVVPHVSDVYLDGFTMDSVMQEYKDKMYGKYPADGLVVTFGYLPVMNAGSHEVQYLAKAFKFPSEIVDSEVTDVEWNLSKTRYLIPRIRIKPVQISGSTVEYCTGYNAKYIQDNNIGVGTKVKITKANEIIPNIVEVIEPTTSKIPDVCPECKQLLSWNGVHLQCNNPVCGNATLQDSLIWVSNISPMDGLGDTLKAKFLNMLVQGNELKDASVESIMDSKLKLPEDTNSAQQNLFAKMWNDLHTCKVPAMNAILALNIPRIGGITAMKLASRMDLLWEAYEGSISDPPYVPLSTSAILSGVIGRANSDAIESNLSKVSRLRYLVGRIEEPSKHTTSKGKVAITGKLSVKRSQFESELRECGYEAGEISKDTKYLITDDPTSNSSKANFARKNNIQMISESDFRQLYMNEEVHL